MKSNKIITVNIIMPLISGIATGLAYSGEKLSFLIFLSISPYIYSILIDYKLYKSFIYSISLYFTSLCWIANITSAITDIIILRLIISIIIISALSLLLSFFLNLPLYIFKCYKFSVFYKCVTLPFLYIFGEWLQGQFIPIAFPWVRIVNIASSFTVLIQSASVFGGLFISLIILFINSAAALIFIKIKLNRKFIYTSAVLAITITNLIYGANYLNKNKFHNAEALNVMIIQGNYPKETKFSSSSEDILNKYISMIYGSIDKDTDYILFPETAMHSDIYVKPELKTRLSDICNDYGVIILFGTQYNDDGKYYNSCMAFYPDNKDSAIYLKRILVPFGEYNPFKLFKFQFTSTNFSPGEECSIINTEKGNIGCAICFESVFPEASVDCVKAGAEVITVLTNDSWLGERLPLYQHHTHSIIRAVETNRYILTSTNTGISSVISNRGEIKSETDYNNEAVIEDTFYMISENSIYTHLGDIIIFPSCIIIILTVILYLRNQIFSKKS